MDFQEPKVSDNKIFYLKDMSHSFVNILMSKCLKFTFPKYIKLSCVSSAIVYHNFPFLLK
jgi:hypothetical protein